MTPLQHRLALGTSALALLAGTLATSFAVAPTAHAAGRTYGTVISVSTAELKACKEPIQDGTKYRVFAFLDNTASAPRAKAYGRITVLKDGQHTQQSYQTPYIAGGRRSDVGWVVLPKQGGRTLEVVAAGTNAGSGAEITASDVRNC